MEHRPISPSDIQISTDLPRKSSEAADLPKNSPGKGGTLPKNATLSKKQPGSSKRASFKSFIRGAELWDDTDEGKDTPESLGSGDARTSLGSGSGEARSSLGSGGEVRSSLGSSGEVRSNVTSLGSSGSGSTPSSGVGSSKVNSTPSPDDE